MTEWTEEWPTEPGRYWFWGQPHYGLRDLDPQLYAVIAHETPHGLAYVADGSLMYKGGGGWGVWYPAVVPDPPRDEGGKQ